MVEYGEGTEVEAADYPYSIGRLPSSGKLTVFNSPTKGGPNSEDSFTFLNISAYLSRESINPLKGETLGINLSLNCPGNISIKILDQYGRNEKNILSNELITSKKNLFFWDGLNENRKYVNNGIYICYIAASQEEKNKKIEKKLIFNVIKPSKNKKTGCIITNFLK
ncbi:hypothetical protein HY745_02940 [Candidatus Desantisbacteria bacterium]|nr:hypothetical protein [Candidatus Desantisbacteria bacterium]